MDNGGMEIYYIIQCTSWKLWKFQACLMVGKGIQQINVEHTCQELLYPHFVIIFTNGKKSWSREILYTGVISSGMLVNGSLKKSFFVVIASFQGVSTPTVADFKLLMGHHWMWVCV